MKYMLLLLFLFFGSNAVAQGVFFSEYIEGTSSNKALEIYNGTGDDVDLSQYRVYRANNGSTVWQDSLDLTGTLAAGEVYVIANPSADEEILALADTTHSITFYNGNDALYLVMNSEGWVTIDVLGIMGEDMIWDVGGTPEAMHEQTLIRKNAVISGNTDWAAAAGTTVLDGEWRVLPQDYDYNLGMHTVGGYQVYSIYELQYVPDPAVEEGSRFLGLSDTIVVQGKIMHGANELWIGSRWSTFILDPNTFPDPWSGFFIVQNDTFAIGTLFQFIEPGMIVNFTGVLATFGGLTQLNLITNPVIPIEIVSAGNPIPEPLVLTAADLDGPIGEQWEGMFVKLENVEMVNRSITGDIGSITDASGGTTYISEYFQIFDDAFNDGINLFPSTGTRFTLTGFVREESTATPGDIYSVNPRDLSDIIILTNPPQISGIMRDPEVPFSNDLVSVSAIIVDEAPGTVQSAVLNYSVDEGTFIQISMTADVDTFSASIPAQADGAFVRYFVTAEDDDADKVSQPADTSRANGRVFFYTIRDDGFNIADVQNTHGYFGDQSGYVGYEVTLTGVVMTDSTDEVGDIYIQDASAAWSGIWVNSVPRAYPKGDEVSVVGMIEENFGITRMNNVTDITLLNAGVGAFDAVDVTTAEIGNGGENLEAFESVLVRISNLTVTNPFPDAPSNFGEFTVSDGSGDLRIDDNFDAFSGQGNDTTYALDLHIDEILGMGYFSFGNAKLIPRDSTDVVIGPTAIQQVDNLPGSFALEQNYPNPFNPSTTIKYHIAEASKVKLTIYDIIGRKIANLVQARQAPGEYTITFDASQLATGVYFYKLEAGNFTKTHKMLLIK